MFFATIMYISSDWLIPRHAGRNPLVKPIAMAAKAAVADKPAAAPHRIGKICFFNLATSFSTLYHKAKCAGAKLRSYKLCNNVCQYLQKEVLY